MDQRWSMCPNLHPVGGKLLGRTPTSRVVTGWREKGVPPSTSGRARKEPPHGGREWSLRGEGQVDNLDEHEHRPQPEGMGVRPPQLSINRLQPLQDQHSNLCSAGVRGAVWLPIPWSFSEERLHPSSQTRREGGDSDSPREEMDCRDQASLNLLTPPGLGMCLCAQPLRG